MVTDFDGKRTVSNEALIAYSFEESQQEALYRLTED